MRPEFEPFSDKTVLLVARGSEAAREAACRSRSLSEAAGEADRVVFYWPA
jgi:hypothetical protein